MQRNPQTPQGQRPAGRTPQAYANPQNRPPVNSRPAATGARPVQRSPMQQAQRPAQGRAPQTSQRPAAHPAARPAAASAQPQRKPSVQCAAQPRSNAPAFTGRRDNTPLIIAAIAIALILGVGCLMQYVIYPNGYFPSDTVRAVTAVAEIASTRGVRINEVMTSNKTALSDEEALIRTGSS